MFLIGHQDFVSRFQVDAVGNVTVRFGGVAKQSNLVTMAAHERGEGITKLIPGSVSPDGIVFGILLVHLLRGGVALEHGAQHGRGAGPDGAVVQIDFVLGNQELLAQFCPVGVFILIEESGVGQGRGNFLKLGNEVPTNGQGGGECGCGREETAAVEQAHLRGRNGLCYDLRGRRARRESVAR